MSANRNTGKAAPMSYRKEKIITMNRFAKRRDLLSALLVDGKSYTLDQVETMIQKFMKGKVN